MSDVLWDVYSIDDVAHAISVPIELRQKCCEVRHGVSICLCGCVGGATGGVGVPPVVEVGVGHLR